VAPGKGIAVHHHCAGISVSPGARKKSCVGLNIFYKLFYAILFIFHEKGVAGFGDGKKPKAVKELLIFRFGKNKKMMPSPPGRFSDQLRDEPGRGAGALKIPVYGNAFQYPAVQGTGGDYPVFFPQNYGAFNPLIVFEALLFQETAEFLQGFPPKGEAGV
jgi:hypothetical protein